MYGQAYCKKLQFCVVILSLALCAISKQNDDSSRRYFPSRLNHHKHPKHHDAISLGRNKHRKRAPIAKAQEKRVVLEQSLVLYNAANVDVNPSKSKSKFNRATRLHLSRLFDKRHKTAGKYTDAPNTKRQDIYDGYDENSNQDLVMNDAHGMTQTAGSDGNTNTLDTYAEDSGKRGDSNELGDLKRVEDADHAVDDVINSIMSDDDKLEKYINDGNENRKSSSSVPSDVNDADFDVVIDEKMEKERVRNQSLSKENLKNVKEKAQELVQSSPGNTEDARIPNGIQSSEKTAGQTWSVNMESRNRGESSDISATFNGVNGIHSNKAIKPSETAMNNGDNLMHSTWEEQSNGQQSIMNEDKVDNIEVDDVESEGPQSPMGKTSQNYKTEADNKFENASVHPTNNDDGDKKGASPGNHTGPLHIGNTNNSGAEDLSNMTSISNISKGNNDQKIPKLTSKINSFENIDSKNETVSRHVNNFTANNGNHSNDSNNRTAEQQDVKTAQSKFLTQHPHTFKILMEYFQNETSLQEKLRNKLNALRKTKINENAIKKSFANVHEGEFEKKMVQFYHQTDAKNMRPLPWREFVADFLKLATHEDEKTTKPSQAPNPRKISNLKRKADVALVGHVTPSFHVGNSSDENDVQNKAAVRVVDSSLNNALGVVEKSIDNMISQNEIPENTPNTESNATTEGVTISPVTGESNAPNDTQQNVTFTNNNNLDFNTLQYKKQLKSLEISLSQDFFNLWMYHYRSYEEMSVKPEQLRSGIANLGSTDRLERVIKKALRGENVNLLVVGGSISAGGGLEKDRLDIHGIYYKAFVEWWRNIVTPITASDLRLSVVAIGGTDSEYFSYCVKNYIHEEPDLVVWELAANDYRRYVGRNMDPAQPLEQLTRVLLTLPSQPALMFVNFFRGDYYKTTLGQDCPDSEDEGGRLVAEYYKITSLSWRNVICSEMKPDIPGNIAAKREYTPLTLRTLFSSDGYHPSLLGHAQCATLLILYIRSVFEEVVSRETSKIDQGVVSSELKNPPQYNIPRPIYNDPDKPNPMCWTLLTADYRYKIENQLPSMRIIEANGFEFANVTHWPVRMDRLRCLKAMFPQASLKIKFEVPHRKDEQTLRDIVLISHNSFSGSAKLWLDNNESDGVILDEPAGQKRTQTNVLPRVSTPGFHVITIRSIQPGFCVSALAIL